MRPKSSFNNFLVPYTLFNLKTPIVKVKVEIFT